MIILILIKNEHYFSFIKQKSQKKLKKYWIEVTCRILDEDEGERPLPLYTHPHPSLIQSDWSETVTGRQNSEISIRLKKKRNSNEFLRLFRYAHRWPMKKFVQINIIFFMIFSSIIMMNQIPNLWKFYLNGILNHHARINFSLYQAIHTNGRSWIMH